MRLICSYWNVGSFPLQKKTMSIYLPPAFKTESRDRVLLASVDNEKLHIESWGIFSNRLYPIEKYYVSFEDTKCEIGYIIGWIKNHEGQKKLKRGIGTRGGDDFRLPILVNALPIAAFAAE